MNTGACLQLTRYSQYSFSEQWKTSFLSWPSNFKSQLKPHHEETIFNLVHVLALCYCNGSMMIIIILHHKSSHITFYDVLISLVTQFESESKCCLILTLCKSEIRQIVGVGLNFHFGKPSFNICRCPPLATQKENNYVLNSYLVMLI